ncbi:MAG TPA: hypothetical protein VF607_00550, partial [Verrucomicrobiae bacterium]
SNKFFRLGRYGVYSKVAGFEREWVGTNSFVPIADQFLGGGNNLNAVTQGASAAVVAGTKIQKWNGTTAYNIYTWNGSDWGGHGQETLNPGEGAFLVNASTNTYYVTFAGLVPRGLYAIGKSFNFSYDFISAPVPVGGAIMADLHFNPGVFDFIIPWRNGGFWTYIYDPMDLDPGSDTPTGWYDNNNNYCAEPIINIGESFFYYQNSEPKIPWLWNWTY